MLSYALFPPGRGRLLQIRQAAKYKLDRTLYDEKSKVHPV